MNEEQFSKLMEHSRLKMPFSDFEERTMARIQREKEVKIASHRYRKLSWLFFVLGAVIGALATGLVTRLPGMEGDTFGLFCKLAYVLLLVAGLHYLVTKTDTSTTKP
jgi:anaerobic C4-dicarboxylate transporter